MPADDRYGWVVAWTSFAVISVTGAAYYIGVVALKDVAAEFDWPRSIPALSYSAALLGTGIGGIFMGRWSDRVGVAIPVMTGTLMIAFGCLLASISQGKWQLWIAHGVFIGLLGNAAMFGPLLSNVTRWFTKRRGVAVGLVATGQAVAGSVWSPVFAHLNEVIGWRQTYASFAAVVLIVLLPAWLFLRRRPPVLVIVRSEVSPASVDARAPRGLSPGLALILLCAAIVGCCTAMSMPLVHLVAHGTDLGYTTNQAVQLLSAVLGFAIGSRLFWGWASDIIGGLPTLLVCSLCQAVSLVLFTVVTSLGGLFAVCVLFGLGFGGIVPSYAVISRQLLPVEGLAMRVGIILFFGTIGMALGGWLGAAVFDSTRSYETAFLAGLGFNIANVAIVGWMTFRVYVSRQGGLFSVGVKD